jgi:hypothetical protein
MRNLRIVIGTGQGGRELASPFSELAVESPALSYGREDYNAQKNEHSLPPPPNWQLRTCGITVQSSE